MKADLERDRRNTVAEYRNFAAEQRSYIDDIVSQMRNAWDSVNGHQVATVNPKEKVNWQKEKVNWQKEGF